MITTRYIGRLGNSMFQLAACIGYAKKYGYQWASPSNPRESSILRVFPNLPKTHAQPNTYPKKDGYDAKYYNYQEIPDVGDNILLAGFFQSWKYFDHCKDEIKKVFALDYYPEYKDYVSIHVRRGDFVQYAGSFPPITSDYVYEAMQIMINEGHKHFTVFSDDIQWCVENIPIHKNIGANLRFGVTIDFINPGDERKSLSAMASCSHHIIANSSFSWWGAWLGNNPNKIIVSPDHTSWYGPENTVKDPIDLIPPEWIQIKFR